MATVLKIIDADGEIDLMDNVNYRLRRGWAPKIAGRKRGPWGANGPYWDVQEEITIDILGVSAQAALARLEDLLAKLEYAERWYEGEETSGGPCYLEYAPNGSSLASTPTQALILGRADNDVDSSMIELSPEFNEVGGRYEILNVVIRLWRAGWWVSPSSIEVDRSSSTLANPLVLSVTYPSAPIYSPVRLSFGDISAIAGGVLGKGHIAITNDSTLIQFVQGEAATVSGTNADTADTTASGGNVSRLTASVGATFALTWSAAGANLAAAAQDVGTAGEVAFIMACRNRNTTNTWTAQLVVTTADGQTLTADAVPVPPSTNTSYNPQYIHLGSINTGGADIISMVLTIISPLIDGATFDIDYVAPIGLPNDACRIITLTEPTAWNYDYLIIDHHWLSRRSPIVYGSNSPTGATIDKLLAHRGDPLLVHGGSPNTEDLAATIFTNSDTYYGLRTAGVVAIAVQMFAKRRQAYLVPR